MSRNLTNIHSSIRTLNNLEDTSIAGTNLNKVGLTINLDEDLINLETINTFKIGLTTNNTDNQFLVKSIEYSDGDILQVDSNNKLNKITVDTILGNIVAGTNLTKTNNTINLDSNLTNLSLINTFKIGLSAIDNGSTLLRNSEVLSNGDYLQINSDGYVVGVSLIENKNAILGSDNTAGVIAGSNISKTVDVTNGDITLNSVNTTYTGGTNISISGTAINLDTSLTNLSLINTFKIGGNATSETTLLINNGNLFNGDYLKINSAGKVIGQNIVHTKNAILGINNTSGILVGSNMSKTVDTINGDITLNSVNTTYTVALPLTLSSQNKIGLAGLTSYGNDNQILRMNGTNSIEWSNEQDISGFVTADSTTTFTNKSMSYGQITSRPFDIYYNVSVMTANYSSVFKSVNNRCILFSNSSLKYRHGIKHNNTNLEFYLSTTDDGYAGLNKKLTIGLTSIQPTVDISLLAVGNSTGVSQIIKFNNDNLNTIGANFNTEVGNAGGLEIKGYAIIENIITRTDTTKNMRSILSHNGFHVIKGTDLVNDETLLLLRDGATNYLGHVSNNLIIDGYDISIGSASGLMKLRSATLEYYYYNTTNLIFTAKIYDNKYEFQAKHIRCGGELNMRDNSTLGRINMADGPIFWRNRYKSGENTYTTDFNHYTQYSSSPVDGIRHQGWNGVSLGYTNGGPGTALYTYGSGVYFGNGTPVSSDDRIKFNETKITYNALETINKLVVVEYDKKYNRDLPETQYGVEMANHLLNDTPQKEYGYIAQDTYNNIPELRFTIKNVDTTIPENFDENGLLIEDCKIRNTNSDGDEFIDRKYLSIDYNNINVLNVRAVQELSEIVKQQQEQINQQQIIIDKLINSTTFANFRKLL